ncbi:unnamed protein product [Brassica rapa]|uniref:Uncharacterized protein n=1 Tax=Brassica campestris TaxID=3711 RepID=A0A3P6CFK3_BRACM|nr:unnamed protein product [Brassica rapa]VDD17193.1 unnamed protein product [Brassica rapa]
MLEIDYFLRLLHTMRTDGFQNKFLQCYYEGNSNSMDVCPYEGWKQIHKVCIRLSYTVATATSKNYTFKAGWFVTSIIFVMDRVKFLGASSSRV